MVFPYMDHDLAGLIENKNVDFSEPQIKCYMKQLFEGTLYLHSVNILLMGWNYIYLYIFNIYLLIYIFM